MQDYEPALKYTEAFLSVEPQNRQVKDLQKYIKHKMKTGKYCV